jgi:hypothetical protein
VLGYDLRINKIYDGWFFVGRPTLEELRHDLREIMQSRKDYRYEAFNTPGVKRVRIPQQEWKDGPPPLGANGLEVARGVVRSWPRTRARSRQERRPELSCLFVAPPGCSTRRRRGGREVKDHLYAGGAVGMYPLEAGQQLIQHGVERRSFLS